MEIISLPESIIEYILISSALLLIMGLLSFFAILSLKVQGRAKLLVCALIIILPLTYPLKALFPESAKVPVHFEMNYFHQHMEKNSGKTVSTNKPFIADNRWETGKTQSRENLFEENKASLPVLKDSFMGAIPALMGSWKVIASVVWGGVFFFFLLRIVATGYNSNRFLKFAYPVTNPDILKLFHHCVSQTGLRSTPRLLMVEGISTPMLMGFLKPGIIIPPGLLKSEFREGLRFTLLHELKHLQQRHNWWLLFESIIGAAYFFHPVFHWAKRKIHEELENICDRHVTHVTDKSVSYADFLLNQIWQQSSGRNPALALPFATNVSKTTSRIHSILESARPTAFIRIRDRISVYLVLMIFPAILLLSFTPSVPPSGKVLNELNPLKTDSDERVYKNIEPVAHKKEVSIIEDSPAGSLIKVPSHIEKSIPVIKTPDPTESPDQMVRDEKSFEPELKPESNSIEKADGGNKSEINRESPELDIINSLNILGSLSGTNILGTQSEPENNKASGKSLTSVMIAEKYLGPPVNELSINRIDNIRVLDEYTVLFIMRGGDLFLTRLSVPYPGLLYATDFSFGSNLGKLSNNDQIQAISHGQIMGTPGMLGPIYPYKYEGNKYDAIKLLEKSLLAGLVKEGAFKKS